MKCPNCKEPNLLLSERKGIEIDYCPECRGIWLDRGELDKLLEKAKAEEPAPRAESAPMSREPQRPEYYQKPYKRRKSFLEELFD